MNNQQPTEKVQENLWEINQRIQNQVLNLITLISKESENKRNPLTKWEISTKKNNSRYKNLWLWKIIGMSEMFLNK